MQLISNKFSCITFLIALFSILSSLNIDKIYADNWQEHFEPGHTKDEIFKEFNLHREKWWNYYARGRWFADSMFWNEAADDFKTALNFRSTDQRGARSYGMHFWDYFARRELGICYYHMDKHSEAIQELEESLKTVDTAKAKYYLNKARLAQLTKGRIDKTPPELVVDSFKDKEYVNSNILKVKGRVKDDYFSNAIWINNEKEFVELASKEISFDKDVKLHPGGNIITIKAADLVGNQVNKSFKLTLDIRSPIIMVHDISSNKSIGNNYVTIKGSLADDHRINRFWINDKEIPVTKKDKLLFDEQINISSLDYIILKAEDIAGNIVVGKYSLDKNKLDQYRSSNHIYRSEYPPYMTVIFPQSKNNRDLIQLTSLNNKLIPSLLHAKYIGNNNSTSTYNENSMVLINRPQITSDFKSMTVYENRFALTVEAHDNAGLKKLMVNDRIVLCDSARDIYVNFVFDLNEGDNVLNISAENIIGKETIELPIVIKKETHKIFQTGSRLSVALIPFKRLGSISVTSDFVYPLLQDAFFEEPVRFNFVERDRDRLINIIKEQKISNKNLTPAASAVKLGKIIPAEGMLFGTIVEDGKGLNITISLVDTETTKVIFVTDIYTEEKSFEYLRWLMEALTLKVKQKYPMLQGTVIRASRKKYFVNIGSEKGILHGMKFLPFREVTVSDTVIKVSIDAVTKVYDVDKDYCMAKRISGKEKIEVNDFVITK